MTVISNGISERFEIYDEYGVLILPEYAAVAYRPEHDTVLLRINDAFFESLDYPNAFEEVMEVCFADIDAPSPYDHMMTKKQARDIVTFMQRHRDKNFVVHCQAGISRSSAVACAWAYMRNIPALERRIRQSPYFDPNEHVYQLLVNEIDGRDAAA